MLGLLGIWDGANVLGALVEGAKLCDGAPVIGPLPCDVVNAPVALRLKLIPPPVPNECETPWLSCCDWLTMLRAVCNEVACCCAVTGCKAVPDART